jgi:hypothetical protein
MKRNKVWIFSAFFSVVALFSGCFNKSKPVEIKVFFPNYTWNRFVPMDAKFEIDKTDKMYEVAVSLSVIDGFEQVEEVPVEMVITSPDGQENIVNKTIVVKKDGKYFGKASGDVWTTEIIVYPEKQFSQAGTYSVYIQNRTQYYDLYKTESLSFIVRPAKKAKNE